MASQVPTSGAAAAASVDVFSRKDEFLGFGVIRDPNPVLHELRATCPVQHGSVSGKFGRPGPDTIYATEDEQISVLGYAEAEDVWRDTTRFSSSIMRELLGSVIGETILEMDPPLHTRFRSLLQAAFSRAEVERWERDFVRRIAVETIDGLAPKGRADLSKDFAFYLPIKIIAAACDLPVDDVPAFYHQAAVLTSVAAPEAERLEAAAQMEQLVLPLVEARRDAPGDDLISILATSEVKDDDGSEHWLSNDEIVSFIRLLVPAGAQTTYRALTNLLLGLLTHPEQLDAIRKDRSLIPQAIEEGLRWEPPIISFFRRVTVDTDVAGCPVAAGHTVNVCVGAANRDPRRWDEPDEFDIHRTQVGHMAFGQGRHLCLGIHMARMELRVFLEELLDRLPNLRLDEAAGDAPYVDGLFYRTALKIPCVWDL